MSVEEEEDIEVEILHLIDQLLDDIEYEDTDHICDDCSIIDSTVKRQNRSQNSTTDNSHELYLCSTCSQKRHEDAQKVLKDLETLAHEVEQRLKAIENTERELDQWRDQQLQKNRDFWDGKLFCFYFLSFNEFIYLKNIVVKLKIFQHVVYVHYNMNFV